jgi:bacteriocin-like protein
MQRNDMADDMTKLKAFQALNNEELDSVSGGCKCTDDTLSQGKFVHWCKEEK